MRMQLINTVGILTGASRGLGVRIAEALASKGASLALAARSAEALEETANKVRAKGGRAITVPTDVSDRAALELLVKRTNDELGPIDLLVNNAGVECVGYFEQLDADHIAATVATNLEAPIMLTRLVAPQMIERRRGHIVNISSAAGKAARPYGVVYSATKHGVVGFSWSLRAELAPHNVGVSVICPGYVTGEGMFAKRETYAGRPPGNIGVVQSSDVADAVVSAIEKNKAEAVIAPALVKIADVFHALSPDFAMGVARRSGAYKYLRKEATGD
jgi:short-subunit dehydrogenase